MKYGLLTILFLSAMTAQAHANDDTNKKYCQRSCTVAGEVEVDLNGKHTCLKQENCAPCYGYMKDQGLCAIGIDADLYYNVDVTLSEGSGSKNTPILSGTTNSIDNSAQGK